MSFSLHINLAICENTEHVYIKFYDNIRKKVTKTYQLMQIALRDATMSCAWDLNGSNTLKGFSCLSIKSDKCPGCPSSSRNDESVWFSVKWQKIDYLCNGWRGGNFLRFMTGHFNWRFENEAWICQVCSTTADKGASNLLECAETNENMLIFITHSLLT